jgi:hypothetical protein
MGCDNHMVIKFAGHDDEPYARLPNSTARMRMSAKAKGLLLYFASLPKDWKIHLSKVAEDFTDGVKSLRRGMYELQELGLAKKAYVRSEDGRRLVGCDWVVYPRPQRDVERPFGVNTLSTHYKRKIEEKQKKEASARAAREASAGVTFHLSPKSSIEKLCDEFANFTIEKNLHAGEYGSTRTGWNQRTIRRWKRHLKRLVAQLGGETEDVKAVMRWYFDHREDEYVPKVCTIEDFCRKYTRLLAAMERAGDTTLNNGKIERGPKIHVTILKSNHRSKRTTTDEDS